jgi:hypothetical protein
LDILCPYLAAAAIVRRYLGSLSATLFSKPTPYLKVDS